MELRRVFKAAAGSLEQHTLAIRHRELDGYLLLTALGVNAGGAVDQQGRFSVSQAAEGNREHNTQGIKHRELDG